MQNLNLEMDDLFRKAADHYKLRPCESKWNEISGKILSNTHLPQLTNKLVKSKYSRVVIIFLIFFLLPIAISIAILRT